MKTLDRQHKYSGFARTENRTEEIPLHEDFLILAKFAEDAAKTAYAYEKCTEAKKKEAERLFEEAMRKTAEQFEIISGYEIIQTLIKCKEGET